MLFPLVSKHAFFLLFYYSQVCQHPNTRMREWGAEAITALIKAGLAYKHDPPLSQNQVKQLTIYIFFPLIFTDRR